MSLLAASLILGALLAQSAAVSARVPPERARKVVCEGPLPFSESELRQALLVRWQHLGDVSVVRVRAEDGRALIQVGATERKVDLDGRVGEEAARVVAVMALDLAQAETPLVVPAPPEVVVAARAEHEITPPPRLHQLVRTGGLVLGPFDQSGLVAHLEPTIDVGWEVVPGLGAFVTAGYRQATSADVGRALVLRELPVRAGIALRRRWLELRAGGVARSRFVEGPRSHRATAWGGAVALAARLALTSNVLLVVTGGLDLFPTRLVFAVDDRTSLTTPWVSPWLGAGLAWELAL